MHYITAKVLEDFLYERQFRRERSANALATYKCKDTCPTTCCTTVEKKRGEPMLSVVTDTGLLSSPRPANSITNQQEISSRIYIRDMSTLAKEWDELVTWLAYRYACTYYMGLVAWRKGKYTEAEDQGQPLEPTLALNLPPVGDCRKLRRRLSAKLFSARYRILDEDYQCLLARSFRHDQTLLRQRFLTRVGYLDRHFGRFVGGEKGLAEGKKRARLSVRGYVYKGGLFDIQDNFDVDVQVDDYIVELKRRYESYAGGVYVPAPWLSEGIDLGGEMFILPCKKPKKALWKRVVEGGVIRCFEAL